MNEQKATEIVRCLCQEGWDAYIAGGAARDLLSGATPEDFDVVTEAPYDIVEQLFSGRKVSTVGQSFKVAIVDGIEVATYRKDTYFGLSDKNCKIEPAKTIQEDLARRDLTINSMALCPYSGDIVDLYGGIEDLKSKTIKFTGDPSERIFEDPCRILRACRFLAKIEGSFDHETFSALKKHNEFAKLHVAPERIRLEILKAMKCRQPSLFFDALHRIDVLQYIFPSMEACFGFTGGAFHAETVDQHLMIAGDGTTLRKPLLRLAGFLHDIGKPATFSADGSFLQHEKVGAEITRKELQALKFSKKEIDYVANLIRYHMRSLVNYTPKSIRRLLFRLQENNINWKDWFQLRIADRNANLAKEPLSRGWFQGIIFAFRNELNPKTPFGLKDLAVNGKDIMELLDISPGPEIGKILNQLFELVLDNPDFNDREQLTKFIKRRE